MEEVAYPSYRAPMSALSEGVVDEATGALDELVREAVGADGVEQSVVVGQRAVPEIVRFAEENGSDLIVIATHGRGFISHAVMGSTTERVLRRAPCPVLVVRQAGE